jgi:hypothetical protein
MHILYIHLWKLTRDRQKTRMCSSKSTIFWAYIPRHSGHGQLAQQTIRNSLMHKTEIHGDSRHCWNLISQLQHRKKIIFASFQWSYYSWVITFIFVHLAIFSLLDEACRQEKTMVVWVRSPSPWNHKIATKEDPKNLPCRDLLSIMIVCNK